MKEEEREMEEEEKLATEMQWISSETTTAIVTPVGIWMEMDLMLEAPMER